MRSRSWNFRACHPGMGSRIGRGPNMSFNARTRPSFPYTFCRPRNRSWSCSHFIHLPESLSLAMSLHRPFQIISRSTISHTSRTSRCNQRRWLATPVGAADAATLPLAGIKVLDMTRVLAGVCLWKPSKLEFLLLIKR